MTIHSINELAECYKTSANHLESVLSNRARRDIYVAESPTSVRIGAFVGECNADFNVVCKYPFESSAVNVFLDTIEHTCTAAYDEAFDDPIEMLMNMTDPGMDMTQDRALMILSQAEANGWHLDPQIGWYDIVEMYGDLEAEQEDEE